MPTLDIQVAANADDIEIEPAVSAFEAAFAQVWMGNSTAEGIFDGAWRFANIQVPQGAIITSASISFAAVNVGGTGGGSTVNLRIFGIAEDDHVAPTTFGQWQTDHGIHTSTYVDWDFPRATSGNIGTASVAPIIQELVNRAGWTPGNDIGIHIDDDSSLSDRYQEVASLEHATLSPAVLHIDYVVALTQPSPPEPVPGVLIEGIGPAILIEGTGSSTLLETTAAGQIPVVQAVETDTATAMGERKSKAIGQAVETDTAATITRSKSKAIGQAVETDTATAMGERKSKTVNQAIETDSATAMGERKSKAIAQAVETDTAGTIGEAKSKTVIQAIESDTATAMGERKAKALAQALETDTAGTIGEAKSKLVGQALETDSADVITPSTGNNIPVVQAIETDSAAAMGERKSKALAQPVESDTAGALGEAKARMLGQAIELDIALTITAAVPPVLLPPFESIGVAAGREAKGAIAGRESEADVTARELAGRGAGAESGASASSFEGG